MEQGENDCLSELKQIHREISDAIEARLNEFKDVWYAESSDDVLTELLFCILTPQSDAHRCWDIIVRLKDEGKIFTIGKEELTGYLEKGARFKNNKAAYFLEARTLFRTGLDIREHLTEFKDPCKAREWLVANIRGIGYKEASHFLRNIGWGSELAILDRHILKCLVRCGALESMPKGINGRAYCEIEEVMRSFSRELGIPTDHMDFVMWYKEKGEIFK